MSGRTYRTRKPEVIVDEMKDMARKYGIAEFEFHDDSLTIIPTRINQLCKLINESGLPIRWGCQSRANISKDLIKTMRNSGCRAIQFGVESGNDRVLASINKGINIKSVESSVIYAVDIGIPFVTCTFVIGLPEDTRKSVEDTITLAMKLKKYGARVTFGLFTLCPAPSPFSNPRNTGSALLHRDWCKYDLAHAVIQTKHLNVEEINKYYSGGFLRRISGRWVPTITSYSILEYRGASCRAWLSQKGRSVMTESGDISLKKIWRVTLVPSVQSLVVFVGVIAF